jgi:hypothetical protein
MKKIFYALLPLVMFACSNAETTGNPAGKSRADDPDQFNRKAKNNGIGNVQSDSTMNNSQLNTNATADSLNR